MPIFAPIISVTPGPLEDGSNPIVDRMLSIIEDLYVNSGAKALLACDNPAKKRGWKIDWSGTLPSSDVKAGILDIGFRSPSISWAPCGCYDTADWASLSLGLSSGYIAARKIRKKAVRDISIYIKSKFESPIYTLKYNWYRYKNWGLADWDKYVKLPPVPAGHKRLYRLNGSVPVTADDADGWGTARWFTDDPKYPERHDRFSVGLTHTTYVDVPIDIANDHHMGNPDGKWIKILNESGEKMNGGRGADADRLIDNPARFCGSPDIAKKEYFIPSDFANQATKVSQFSSLPDIKELNDAWKPMERMFETYDAEKFLDNPAYRNTFLNEWNQNVQNLKDKLDKHFDDSEYVFKWLMKGDEGMLPADPTPDGGWYRPSPAGLENLFRSESEIMKKLVYALGLFVYIEQIMSIADIVTDKNCSPIGQTNFSAPWGLTQKDKIFIKEIRDGRIAKKEQVWAELDPDTCECSECPGGWNFCDNGSITNLYRGSNTCNPPCCGGQEFKPITLVETCKCACPDGQVFMPCDCSDCKEGSGTPLLDLITGAASNDVVGICTTTNPDPSKLEWNPKSCTWECKTRTQSYPPHLWGGSITVPIQPPCKAGQTRKPPDCECCGSYAIDDCNLFDHFNILTNSVKLL